VRCRSSVPLTVMNAWGEPVGHLGGAGQIVILNGPPRSGKSSIASDTQPACHQCCRRLGAPRLFFVPRQILRTCARRLQGLPVLLSACGARSRLPGNAAAPPGAASGTTRAAPSRTRCSYGARPFTSPASMTWRSIRQCFDRRSALMSSPFTSPTVPRRWHFDALRCARSLVVHPPEAWSPTTKLFQPDGKIEGNETRSRSPGAR
jgi:hypothetical protein